MRAVLLVLVLLRVVLEQQQTGGGGSGLYRAGRSTVQRSRSVAAVWYTCLCVAACVHTLFNITRPLFDAWKRRLCDLFLNFILGIHGMRVYYPHKPSRNALFPNLERR